MSKYTNEIMLGGFILLSVGLLAAMSVAVGGFNLQSGVHVTARFSNATGLVKDAAVTVAGVQVGHVERLAVDHDKAVVALFLRKDAGIRDDVWAAIRAKSLLGEKYLELVPQSRDAKLLQDGDTIAQTRSTVEIDELLANLAPLVKEVDPKDVARVVKGLAATIDGEQESLAKVLRNAGTVSEQLADALKTNRAHLDKTAAHLASLTEQGDALLKQHRPSIDRTVAQVDRITGVWSAESPALAARAQRVVGQVDRLTRAVEPQQVSRTMQKLPVLLEKADKVSEGDVKALAKEVLMRNGLRVYLHPFTNPDEPQRPLPAATLKP
ncbi:MAG: MlaD family protein [Candidatus Sericytochromatia bacterium]|nr:MlaD family protein [Candidatus Sericytochromatia bacterium]